MNVPNIQPLPADRGHIATEQRHPDAHQLDQASVDECIALLIDDHQRVTQALSSAHPLLSAFITALIPRIQNNGRLIYIGAGTSGRLGVLDASECPPTFQSDPNQIIGLIAGGDTALRRSSEGLEDNPDGAAQQLRDLHLTANDTLLGIAAGGTTPYVLGALPLAKTAGTLTALLTCSPPVQHPKDCDHLIVLDTGPEILTGSTRLKAGSATKLALNIITTTLFVQLGKTYSNLMVDLRATNTKLRDRAIRIISELCPKLTRAQAATLLHSADGEVKTAVMMHQKNVSQAEAQQILANHNGQLRAALESNHTSPVS